MFVARLWHVACPRKGKPAVGDATVGGGLLRAVPLDKPPLLSTLRVVATLVKIIEGNEFG